METPDRFPQDDLSKLERRLAGWTPTAARSGRDRILFEAGVAAGRRQMRWPMASVLVTLAVGSGGWTFYEHSERKILERALVERSQTLEVALAKRQVDRQPPLSPPVTGSPTSDLGWSHSFETSGGEQPETTLSPSSTQFPASIGPVLTPLSAWSVGDLVGL